MEKLVFATHNAHKLEEVQQMLLNTYKVVGLDEIGCTDEIPETGTTLEENALIKARFIAQNFGMACFADDTGLEAKALDNAPGVYSARYAGEEKSANNNMNKLLQELEGKDDRSARFRTVIALIINKKEHLFEGIIEGTIESTASGENGFGYDPIFRPNGFCCTFASLSSDEKNRISHRGQAVERLIEFLKS